MAKRTVLGGVSVRRSTYGIKVNHLPHNITEEQVSLYFKGYGSIASVFVKDGDNECYAFVNFHSESCAQTAAREMNGAVIGGKRINCRAQTQGGRSSSVGEYAVKVTCLQKFTTSDTLSELFSFGDSDMIQSVKVNTCLSGPFNYAYVNYFSRRDAVRAVNRLDKSLVDGSQIRVSMHPSIPLHASPNSPEPNYRSLITAQPIPRSVKALPNMQAHASSYSRRHSVTPQYVQPAIHHPPAMQRHFSQPSLPVSTATQHIGGTQMCTVKLSIYGDLSPDDLEEVFSQFGEIQEKPIVRPGEPNYCYINFSSPQAATSSLSLSNTTVKGIRVEVKVSRKQRSNTHRESKEVPCASLVASILWIKHRDELERLKKEHQVSLKPSSDCIKMWGQTEQINAVEECLQLLIKRLKEGIVVKNCELPCHSVPLFEQDSTIEEVKKIEASQGVEFCILKQTIPFALASFCEKVKECFTPPKPTQIRNSDAIPMRSDLASFLEVKALKEDSSAAKNTWLWENDSGTGFESYTPTVSSQLSQDYTAYPTGSTLLEIGQHAYEIDFSKMTQTNIASNRSRNIKQAASSTVCVQWLYKDDKKVYVPYTAEQSAEIEQMFQSKTSRHLDIKGNTYTFDFSAMNQCNIVSRNLRKIKRQLKVSEKCIPSEECVITLQVSGLPASLDPAIEELESMVARATVEKESQLYEDSSDEFQVRLIKNMTKYFVTAELVDKSLQLKGMPRYVERVALLAEQEKIWDREQRLQGGGEMECQLPSSWDSQSSNLVLAAVSRGSEEWNNEVSNIRKTLPGATIVKLERIQNQWLWERYSFAKKRMSKTNKDHVNEKHLFHGTRTTEPEKVFNSEKGFDFRYSKAGLWGKGSYFAVNASYSDAYAYRTMHGVNVKQMFICKVLTGESYVAGAKDDSLRQPPLKPVTSQGSFAEERYDSVKGYTNGSDVYVVYDHEKVYPAYLVTYSCIGGYF